MNVIRLSDGASFDSVFAKSKILMVLCNLQKNEQPKYIMEVVPLGSSISGEALWKKSQVKAVVKDGVELMKAIEICRKSDNLPDVDWSELESILCGRNDTWKIYAAKAKDDGHWRLSLIGQTKSWRWRRHGDFEEETSYHRAEMEVKVVKTGSVIWNTVIVESAMENDQSQNGQKMSKHGGFLPRVAVSRVVTA